MNVAATMLRRPESNKKRESRTDDPAHNSSRDSPLG